MRSPRQLQLPALVVQPLNSLALCMPPPPARSCNWTPALRDMFAKPLHPPKLVSFTIGVFSNSPCSWDQLPQASVQLRPMAALWGGPVILLRGIHINPECKVVRSALATAPFMMEWVQLGIMEVFLPSPLAVFLPTPLSPGAKLTVKDVYLRMRTYGAPSIHVLCTAAGLAHT